SASPSAVTQSWLVKQATSYGLGAVRLSSGTQSVQAVDPGLTWARCATVMTPSKTALPNISTRPSVLVSRATEPPPAPGWLTQLVHVAAPGLVFARSFWAPALCVPTLYIRTS